MNSLETIRKTVIVILQGDISSIEYEGETDYEIYKITNLFEYQGYVQSIITKTIPNLTIIIKFVNIENLIKTMYFLNQFDSNREVEKSKFVKQFEKYTRDLQPELNELTIQLTTGQCEVPISFPVTILFDSSEITNEILSPVTVINLQTARYVSLKHGGNIIAVNNTNISLKNISTILDLDIPPKPIMSNEQDGDIEYYIPQGWDSWNKIILQGKSTVSSNSDIIREESKLVQLNMKYDDFFSGKITINEILADLHNKVTTGTTGTTTEIDKSTNLLSLNQFLQEIIQPSIVES